MRNHFKQAPWVSSLHSQRIHVVSCTTDTLPYTPAMRLHHGNGNVTHKNNNVKSGENKTVRGWVKRPPQRDCDLNLGFSVAYCSAAYVSVFVFFFFFCIFSSAPVHSFRQPPSAKNFMKTMFLIHHFYYIFQTRRLFSRYTHLTFECVYRWKWAR